MIEGHFVVIEGIDGSGTTTQCALLADRLSEKGLPAHTTREPSDGPIGVLIRQVLTGRVVTPSPHGARPPTWTTMAALFAADRLDHLEAEIHPNLNDGVAVICDRYDYSSVAYQTVSGGGGEDISSWVLELNRHARRPDLTLVLDVDPVVAASRRDSRSRCRPLSRIFTGKSTNFFQMIELSTSTRTKTSMELPRRFGPRS
jgi:dTMP kinase